MKNLKVHTVSSPFCYSEGKESTAVGGWHDMSAGMVEVQHDENAEPVVVLKAERESIVGHGGCA